MSEIPEVDRGYEAYSQDIELATLRAINTQNSVSPMNFVIDTGDNTDTSIEPEYKAAIDNLDVLKLPWYVVIGNHDVEYEGTFKTDKLIEAILQDAVGVNTSELESKDKIVNYLATVPSFKDYAEQMQANGYGNYTFDPNRLCIVLFFLIPMYIIRIF